MKKFLKSQIKTILTVSSNRKGISLVQIKESFPYEYHKDKIELLLNEDKDVVQIKSKVSEKKDNHIYSLTDDYLKSEKYNQIERKLYNLDYLCSLFKEAEIINIYKLIKDNENITYQQIVNYLLSIYNLKKDIKQVSHYCLILIKMNQILFYQPFIVEKKIKPNIVGNSYLKFLKECGNLVQTEQNKNQNFIKQNTITNNTLNIFQLMTKAFIIDDSEIKNTIMFHLYLNKEKEGVSANELYIACDFIKRGKILNKIISYMENESSIAHKALRKGKIMEFLYHIINEKKVSSRIKYLVNYFKQILDKYNNKEKNEIKKLLNDDSNNEKIEEKKIVEKKETNKERIKNDKIITLNDNENKTECIPLIEEENIKNKKILLESEILNQEDYNFILNKIKGLNKKIIQESEDSNSMRKNIINYISSIERNKNVPLSSYNRYVFILNILYDKKVLSFVEIKHHISNILEKNKNFMIDRKTIRRLLNTLEKTGLIKIVRYELTMRNTCHKYLNSKDEIKQEKIIVCHRDVDINDKIFNHQANELLRNNKKKENNKINFDEKEIEKMIVENKKEENKNINQIVNNFIDKNNDTVKINLKEKLFIPIYNLLKKIYNKRKIDIKKSRNEFIQRLKRNFYNAKYIDNMYETKNKEKDIINKYKNDDFMENYYEKNNFSYANLIKFESQSYSNIIIPKYIMDKYNNTETKNCVLNNIDEQKNIKIFKEMENPNYTIKIKYLNNDNNLIFLDNKEKREKTNILIGNKRYRCSKLKDNNIDNKNFNKIMAINDILDIICNLPGITVKTLRKMLFVNSQNFGIEKSIITYMINLGLIYAQGFDQKNCEIIDDTKLFVYSDINLLI